MHPMRRFAERFVVTVAVLYAATWLIASRTAGPQIEVTFLNQWASFTVERHPGASYQLARARAPQEAEALNVKLVVTRAVPVLPGVALVWYEVSGLFNPGGTAGGYVEELSLVLVYGVVSKVLHSWALAAAP